ncbi:MAG: GNAT family N-acetyltransferase [Candidatus Thorarchaeota archaeon]
MRTLKEREIPAAVEIAAEASKDDPYWVFIEPDPASRIQLMRRFLKANLQTECAKGNLMGVGNPLQGIAVWAFPKSTKPARASRHLKSLSYLRLLSKSTIAMIPKAIRVVWEYRTMRARHAVHPFYHLILIAVAPSSQGRGLASKLIRPVLDMADKREIGAYVETTNPRNVTFYEHFGFALKGMFSIPGCPVRGWGFYRSPKEIMGICNPEF